MPFKSHSGALMRDGKKSLALAIVLLLSLCGCSTVWVLAVKPKIPESQLHGGGTAIYLAPLLEGRETPAYEKDNADVMVGKMDPYVISLDSTPPSIVRESVKKLLENEGFTVFTKKADQTKDMVIIGGKVVEFSVHDRSGFVGAVEADVQFELYVRKGNRIMGKHLFQSSKIQHDVGPGWRVFNRAINNAVDDCLDQVADFIESKEFSKALQGIPIKDVEKKAQQDDE